MSSTQRSPSGDVLVFDLGEERKRSAGPAIRERGGRHARALLKRGPLRVMLVVLAPGGEIAEHQAEGPITVQPLEGRVRFTAGGRVHDVGPGELLAAGPGIRHSVASTEGAAFLLTVVKGEAADENISHG
jgi:quercetin dioxygenase-like cupin family protein